MRLFVCLRVRLLQEYSIIKKELQGLTTDREKAEFFPCSEWGRKHKALPAPSNGPTNHRHRLKYNDDYKPILITKTTNSQCCEPPACCCRRGKRKEGRGGHIRFPVIPSVSTAHSAVVRSSNKHPPLPSLVALRRKSCLNRALCELTGERNLLSETRMWKETNLSLPHVLTPVFLSRPHPSGGTCTCELVAEFRMLKRLVLC